jgi:ABC-type branched-subunit amino acid transport system substrate-binding protein
MNTKKVPQLFVQTGASKWNDPQNFPWTMGWMPNYQNEERIFAKYILKEKPNARIAVLYQNDDYGKDGLKGLKDGLGDKATSMIVVEDAYEVAEANIDSHVVKMKSLNADVFVDIPRQSSRPRPSERRARSAGSRCTSSTMSALPSAAS